MTHDEAKMIFDLIGFGTSDRDLVQIFCDFSRVVAAAEREACAQVCEEVGEHPSLTPRHCAESIRARG